jgi:hypothetical protein
MSAATTGRDQEARLRALGFDVLRADPKRDIDTVDDLAAFSAAFPRLRTAALCRARLVTAPVVR